MNCGEGGGIKKVLDMGEGSAKSAVGFGCCGIVTLALVIISIAAIIDGYHEIKEGHISSIEGTFSLQIGQIHRRR